MLRVESNLQRESRPLLSDRRFFASVESHILAALDVEWTKDYRIKGGSHPFCYSIVLIKVPPFPQSLANCSTAFGFKSVYVGDKEDENSLLESLDKDLSNWTESDVTLAGHQLSSDLSVVRAAFSGNLPHVELTYREWQQRRHRKRVVDTRYDVDGLVTIKSRRLVDVATDIGLDVTQPELGNSSMTALHRAYLNTRDELIRERLMVLNLRHSLSTALVAAVAEGWLARGALNVNKLLLESCWDRFGYLQSTTFQKLVKS